MFMVFLTNYRVMSKKRLLRLGASSENRMDSRDLNREEDEPDETGAAAAERGRQRWDVEDAVPYGGTGRRFVCPWDAYFRPCAGDEILRKAQDDAAEQPKAVPMSLPNFWSCSFRILVYNKCPFH